jgi:hypothetical protein
MSEQIASFLTKDDNVRFVTNGLGDGLSEREEEVASVGNFFQKLLVKIVLFTS